MTLQRPWVNNPVQPHYNPTSTCLLRLGLIRCNHCLLAIGQNITSVCYLDHFFHIRQYWHKDEGRGGGVEKPSNPYDIPASFDRFIVSAGPIKYFQPFWADLTLLCPWDELTMRGGEGTTGGPKVYMNCHLVCQFMPTWQPHFHLIEPPKFHRGGGGSLRRTCYRCLLGTTYTVLGFRCAWWTAEFRLPQCTESDVMKYLLVHSPPRGSCQRECFSIVSGLWQNIYINLSTPT